MVSELGFFDSMPDRKPEEKIGLSYGQNPWVWSAKQRNKEDDSWEVRAFAQDTSGPTWPPRSYTCAFCRREFRSAQALGGHMNVHRRDRARLLHPSPNPYPNANSLLVTTTQDFPRGLCFLYPIQNPNPNSSPPMFSPNTDPTINSMPTLLSISPHPSDTTHSFPSPSSAQYFPISASALSHLHNLEHAFMVEAEAPIMEQEEELDLELRLGVRAAK
ncbi:transcriptional regulator SUPERMAN [Amborella trichopoda]|uniref:C2H2-type domain-containing protein n=1 Tax=Amborella trichopoda TaxID=13333 RepID=W1PNM3_AMBTC|nr:transcriptional regulator SUPERMAN [Amborella trichopoda]ERN09316.1 hypothetical protein AMTR_s00149p00097070 [Amborella trichopoda]|eukprot:XP_006847735.1 transcriptional regulator SUPERMAN [Amborella trichopoda]